MNRKVLDFFHCFFVEGKSKQSCRSEVRNPRGRIRKSLLIRKHLLASIKESWKASLPVGVEGSMFKDGEVKV